MRCPSIAFLALASLSLSACGEIGYSQVGTLLPVPPVATPGTTSTTTVTSTDPAGNTNVTGVLSLTVVGSKFTAGKSVFGALLDANNIMIGNANTVVDTDGAFALDFNKKMMAGGTYSVAYFVDVNSNGFCNISDPNTANANNMDAGYIVQANAVSSNTSLSVTANANVKTVCDYFGQYGITVTGVGFTPHNGQTLYVALMDLADNTYVAGPIGQVVVNGGWKYNWPTVMLADHTYEARYFADQTATHTCQDHAWIYTTPPVSGNISATVSHDEAQSPVCANFPPVPPN